MAFDDPLDSMDGFYSNKFLNILENSNISKIFILTHRSNIMRYGTWTKYKNFIFYNILYEKIPFKIINLIANKSIIEILKIQNKHLAISLLLFFRFCFKNISHSNYHILSDAVDINKTKAKILLLKPVIIDVIGIDLWNKSYKEIETKEIYDFVKENNDFINIVLNKFIWKNHNNLYLKTIRHLTETEPLDLFLIDKNLIKKHN